MILFAMIFSSSNNLTLPGELIPVPFKNPYNDDTNKQKTLFDLPKSAFLHKVDLTWYSRIYAQVPVFYFIPSLLSSRPIRVQTSSGNTYLQTVNLHFEHLYFYSTITIIAPYMW